MIHHAEGQTVRYRVRPEYAILVKTDDMKPFAQPFCLIDKIQAACAGPAMEIYNRFFVSFSVLFHIKVLVLNLNEHAITSSFYLGRKDGIRSQGL